MGERQNGIGQDVACRKLVCNNETLRHIVPNLFCGDAGHPTGETGKQPKKDGTEGRGEPERGPNETGEKDQRNNKNRASTGHNLSEESEQEQQLSARSKVGRKAIRGNVKGDRMQGGTRQLGKTRPLGSKGVHRTKESVRRGNVETLQQ